MIYRNKLFFVLLASVVAACSGDSVALDQGSAVAAGETGGEVSFSGYTQRSAVTTRGGAVGALVNGAAGGGEVSLNSGFGVFGYYTDWHGYDESCKPNFMYNQKVAYQNGYWNYSPIRYWANEPGGDDSSDRDMISFFAYAPYVACDAYGQVDDDATGITGFPRNTATGDPYVRYTGSFRPSAKVDLCWGVCSEDDKSWKILQDGGTQTMQAGMPWLNVQRPLQSTGQHLKFTFRHALAQMNLQISTDADLAAGTKIYVRSISFKGIAQNGALCLNNKTKDKPLWMNSQTTDILDANETVTIHDGRTDGYEGAAGASTTTETPTGLNPILTSDDGNSTAGVTSTVCNLFDSSNVGASVFVIPNGRPLEVTIVYDVETADPHLKGHYLSDGITCGTSIEHCVTKAINVAAGALKLESGRKYTIGLHLGMGSVKFTAEVEEWDENTGV